MQEFKTAFVTGATGLLGNNLVRQLVAQGVRVKILARSAKKAQAQFGDLDLEIIIGDMNNVEAFAKSLEGCDVLFHTAAYFRDSYKGGKHWEELYNTNVIATRKLIESAYEQGIRKIVHTSSIAVLDGATGDLIDESMSRREQDADDYYKSKILSENAVRELLVKYLDLNITFVLPGWMFGPGDLGPTSSGQFIQDFIAQKIPGIPPGSFSVVDARDVAYASIQAAKVGRRGERYLAAGRSMNMKELMGHLGKISGVSGPKKELPYALLLVIAFANEVYARLTGKPVLLSLGSVKIMKKEEGKTNFSPLKSRTELGLEFRSLDETLTDTLASLNVRIKHGTVGEV